MGINIAKHKAYKKFMEHGSRSVNDIEEDIFCAGCKYHRPDWDYRYCRFIECPDIKGAMTYREEYYQEVISY